MNSKLINIHKILVLLFFSFRLISQETIAPDSSEVSIDLSEFIITGQFEPTHFKSANYNVNIITKDQIKQLGAISLDQALQINPTVRISHDPIFGSTIKMRGISSNNVAILIDGIPVIGRLDGKIDLSQINVQNLERIEIVEGALSNIYGSNAAGGVVNLVTKKTQENTLLLKVGSQVESIGQQSFTANIGYRIDKFLFQFHGRTFRYNQFPIDSLRLVNEIDIGNNESILQSKFPFNPKNQIGGGGLVKYTLNNTSSIFIKYDSNLENVYDYGVIKRPQFKPYAEDRRYNTHRSNYLLNFKKNYDHTFIDLTLAYNTYSRVVESNRFYIEDLVFDPLLQIIDTSKFSSLFHRAILSHRFNSNLKGIFGLNSTWEKGYGKNISETIVSKKNGAQFIELAPFLEIKYTFSDKLNIVTSSRYIIHSIYANKLTPSILIKYDLNSKWMLRLAYAQGYRSPSLKELFLDFVDVNHNIIGNQDLTPEVSNDFQLSVEYEFSKYLNWKFNTYNTYISDRISLVEYDVLQYKYDNVDNYNVFGFKSETNFKVKRFVKVSSSIILSYWSTNITNESIPVYGKVLDSNNNIQLNFKKGDFILFLNHRHVGQQPIYQLVNEDVKISTIQSYNFFDLSLNKSLFQNKLSITLGVRNIMDITNVSIISNNSNSIHGMTGQSAISNGRSFFINANYKFEK